MANPPKEQVRNKKYNSSNRLPLMGSDLQERKRETLIISIPVNDVLSSCLLANFPICLCRDGLATDRSDSMGWND
jgi:hypothetical protein